MEQIISLPDRGELKAKILELGMTYHEWAAHNNFKKGLAYQVLHRYSGKVTQESRVYGRQTRAIIRALEAL